MAGVIDPVLFLDGFGAAPDILSIVIRDFQAYPFDAFIGNEVNVVDQLSSFPSDLARVDLLDKRIFLQPIIIDRCDGFLLLCLVQTLA